MTALKITSVGNSAGVLLPKELLAKLRVEKGDMLHVIETENGMNSHLMTLSLMHRSRLQKTSCAKIVISCENWLNDKTDLGQFTRHLGFS